MCLCVYAHVCVRTCVYARVRVCVCMYVCALTVTYNINIGCFVTNILLAVGLFGFFGGITNWIAMELFFVKVPLIYGRCVSVCACVSSSDHRNISGVVGKHYLMIRETFKRIVVEVLFSPTALDEYLQDERNNMNKLLNIG